MKDLHGKNHKSYTSDATNINKASSSNHKSDQKKHSDVSKRKVDLI